MSAQYSESDHLRTGDGRFTFKAKAEPASGMTLAPRPAPATTGLSALTQQDDSGRRGIKSLQGWEVVSTDAEGRHALMGIERPAPGGAGTERLELRFTSNGDIHVDQPGGGRPAPHPFAQNAMREEIISRRDEIVHRIVSNPSSNPEIADWLNENATGPVQAYAGLHEAGEFNRREKADTSEELRVEANVAGHRAYGRYWSASAEADKVAGNVLSRSGMSDRATERVLKDLRKATDDNRVSIDSVQTPRGFTPSARRVRKALQVLRDDSGYLQDQDRAYEAAAAVERLKT